MAALGALILLSMPHPARALSGSHIIPPGCIYALQHLPEPGTLLKVPDSVSITACKDKAIPAPKTKWLIPQVFTYKNLGYLAPYSYVSTTAGTGGLMTISSIAAIRERNGVYDRINLISGDRCTGGIVHTQLAADGINVATDTTPWELINFDRYSRDKAHQPLADSEINLDERPGSCLGMLHWHFAAQTHKQTLRSFTFNENYADYLNISDGGLNGCLSRIALTYAHHSLTLSAQQVHDLQQKFIDTCKPASAP